MKPINERVAKILSRVRKQQWRFHVDAGVKFFSNAETEEEAVEEFTDALIAAGNEYGLTINVTSMRPERFER